MKTEIALVGGEEKTGLRPAGMPIAAVERETGLAKDTLRVWEKRYGFPRPQRDAVGDRVYPAEQVEQLHLLRRLLDSGHRPGRVVGLDAVALQELLRQPGTQGRTKRGRVALRAPVVETPAVDALLDAVAARAPQALRHALAHAQQRMGLESFVVDLLAPLTTAVGEAWAQGRFKVFDEHLYTEVCAGLLRQTIGSLPPPADRGGPRVLLTTLPQEVHGLGLLMVESVLSLEGCSCVSLGTQTPIGDIVQAAGAHRTDVVALSFTAMHGGALVLASLRELRARLPQATALWVGGSCAALYQHPLEGVTAMQPLAGLKDLVAQWRRNRRPPGPGEPA